MHKLCEGLECGKLLMWTTLGQSSITSSLQFTADACIDASKGLDLKRANCNMTGISIQIVGNLGTVV